MHIAVEDNGVGMNSEKIRQLLQTEDAKENDTRTSIGIHNINIRLKMLYGEEYGLSISSEIGKGICVILNIPRKCADSGAFVRHYGMGDCALQTEVF